MKLLAEAGTVSAQVLSLKPDGDQTTVQFILPADARPKEGDKLSLLRGTLEGWFACPARPGRRRQGLCRQGGKANLRPVTVADRDGDSVLLQGLAAGDQIIVSRVAGLHEGTAVTAATAP